MKQKQLHLLFCCNMVIFLTGTGVMAVLPMYSGSLGASNVVIGYYMAVMNLLFAAGTMISGPLARFMPQRILYISVGAIGAIMLGLLSQVDVLWQAILFTSLVWFFGGIGLALSNTFTALLANAKRRGAVFSLMSISLPLASLFGGLIVGPLINFANYGAMFWVLGFVWSLWPISALLWLQKDEARTTDSLTANSETNGLVEENARSANALIVERNDSSRSNIILPTDGIASSSRDRRFLWLFAAGAIASMMIALIRLTIPLSMQALDFSDSAIVSLSSVAGLLTVPLALFYGPLSDSLGKKEILGWRYLLLIVSSLVLIIATSLWHFWAAWLLIFVTKIMSGSISRALVTDILPPTALTSGLNRFEAGCSVAGMFGSILAGYLIDMVDTPVIYAIAAVGAVAALYALSNVTSEHEDNMSVFLRIEQLLVGWLTRDFTARATKRAINGAYTTFSAQNPRWAHSLFDGQFLNQKAEPLLGDLLRGNSQIDARSLACAWTDQLVCEKDKKYEERVDAVAPIAAEFLRLYQLNLPRLRGQV